MLYTYFFAILYINLIKFYKILLRFVFCIIFDVAVMYFIKQKENFALALENFIYNSRHCSIRYAM